MVENWNQLECKSKRVMVVRKPIFVSKEDANFSEALKLYDQKQYKKALKLVEANLKKNSSHAESLALKGCINYHLGNLSEAGSYIEKALKKESNNYLVDHLAGIYYKAVENYPEAAKWMKAAIDNGSPNKQILRDLSLLQSQVRDYKNLVESRQAYLESQPGYRANWTATAVAHHLNKDYKAAVSTLTKIEETIKSYLTDADRYEQSECVLYKNSIIGESGDFQLALDTLNQDEDEIKDKLSVLEYRAKYLLLLGRRKEASLVYRQLLQRNSDNVSYYHLLETALESTSKPLEARVKLYEKLARFYPKSDPPKFLPLTFIPGSHPLFEVKAKEYILPLLQRGVPATFVNVKPLYKNKAKLEVIQKVVTEFFDKEISNFNPTIFVWTKYFLAQHYLYLKDYELASKHIDEALDHSPTLVELYIIKARILKHLGDFEKAADTMNEGRELDLQDRFINSKATKYYLRANKVDQAIDCISLFTKLDEDSVNGCKDLHLMQVNWVLVESAEAYSRLYHQYADKLGELRSNGELTDEDKTIESELVENLELYKGLALKRFHSVLKIFSIFSNDQYDFHSYCMRRGTPRDYVQTLIWEDKIHSTPIYTRVLNGLYKIYMEIYEQQLEKKSLEPDNKPKKNNKKQKKVKSQIQKKKGDLVAKVESVKDDNDPLGAKLLADLTNNANGEIIDNLFALFKPLSEEGKNLILTWEVLFDIHLIKAKYILALQSLKNLSKIINPDNKANEEIDKKILKLWNACNSDSDANLAIKKVVEKGLSTAFPRFEELTK